MAWKEPIPPARNIAASLKSVIYGDKQYIKIAIKLHRLSLTVISSGHFYLILINLTANYAAEINTIDTQCLSCHK